MDLERENETESGFESVIANLSFGGLKALMAVLVRDGIEKRDDFGHVANMYGEALDQALAELIKFGVVEKKGESWGVTSQFSKYWNSSRASGEER